MSCGDLHPRGRAALARRSRTRPGAARRAGRTSDLVRVRARVRARVRVRLRLRA